MKRRNFIGSTVFALSATVAGGFAYPSLQEAVARNKNKAEWKYTGEGGPENWGEVSPDYAVCQAGVQQSPVDLAQPISATLSDLQIDSQPVNLRILHNGHTIRLNTEPGNTLTLDGSKFELVQFHFHLPSEHTVKGEPYPMEVHFVHQGETGFAVLGVFFKEGKENIALKEIWDAMPTQKQPESLIPGVTIEIASLLPPNRSTYRYFGSLTTPPCSEVVRWVVFEEPIEISREQIEQFRQIFPLNARPIQSLNRRFLLYGNES